MLGRAVSALLVATATFLLTAGLPLAEALDPNGEDAPAAPIRVNFQPESSELVCGYAPDFGGSFSERNGLSFGWNFDHSDATRDRDAGDDERLDTLAQFHAGGMWEIAVANGEHEVRASVGDATESSTNVLNVEGVPSFDGEDVPAGQFREVTEIVTVTDGKLTLDQGSAPDFATRINFIEIDVHGEPEGCDEEAERDADEPPRADTTSIATATSVMPTARATSTLPTAPININFQSAGSPTACGYKPDRGKLFAKRHDTAFGWNLDHTKRARDRGVRIDQRKDTLVRFLAGGVWEIVVPKGDHRVKIAVGDASRPSVNTINVEGVNFFDEMRLEADRFATLSLTVPVLDGRLTIDTGKSSIRKTKINYVDINSPGVRECEDTDPITGDDSTGPLPARPYGLSGLRRVFGERCNPEANDGRAYFPSAGGRGNYGYVYFHARLSNLIGNKVLPKINMKKRANDYGVWGYACRMKTGGTSWSVHSWGAAIDTNTLRNPFGQRYWNGRGSNGRAFGRFLPNIWMGRGFYWGLNFNDPMHFQYVSGY
ncbi:MAG: M15 family metallopeptidase [Actinomycetota bacterium]